MPSVPSRDHGDPGDAPSVPPPLTAVANAVRPSAAEEARTIAASTNTGTLATLTPTAIRGRRSSPTDCSAARRCCACPIWPSTAAISPATRGPASRSSRRSASTDPLASGRVTLAGVVEQPAGDERAAARDAHLSAVAAAKYYIDYSDFTLWVLRVRRVRWVGGYGRMDSATGEAYAAAQPDPVRRGRTGRSPISTPTTPTRCVAMAKTLGGYPDTTAATCTGADRYGLDLRLVTERGVAYTRVGYAAPIDSIDQLRSATVELTRRAAGSAPHVPSIDYA